MDKGLIERLAREACFEVAPDGRVLSLSKDEDITRRLTAFAALVAEECAKVAEADGAPVSGVWLPERDFQRKCAEAIRAKFRGTP